MSDPKVRWLQERLTSMIQERDLLKEELEKLGREVFRLGDDVRLLSRALREIFQTSQCSCREARPSGWLCPLCTIRELAKDSE